jgi:glycosyltransferase involved in cell wall biosynthesis
VLPGMAPGGMESMVIQLAADAAARGDSVAVASGPGSWAARLDEAGAVHVALPATTRGTALAMAGAVARLTRCMARLHPNVVHAHNVRATALARAALTACRDRSALMPTIHGLPPADYAMAARILRATAPRVIACAPSVSRSLEAAGFPGCRIDVICNGAALESASPERIERMRRALGLGDQPVVVGIGRLAEQKNWPILIDAASMLGGPGMGVGPGSADGPGQPAFVVAGDGPMRDDLTRLANRSGGRVRFVGAVDDVAALIGLASCVVSTSAWEGLPLTLLEALSLGAPVVATAVDGVADLIPPQAAVLVPPGNPAAVSAAIARVLADPPFTADLRRSALDASAAWRPDRMLAAYREAYTAACAAQRRESRRPDSDRRTRPV